MRICDLTNAYTAASGGVRTYVDAKRRFIQDHTDHEHVLVHPADRDEVVREGRLTTVRIRGPLIPGAAPYRLFVRGGKVHSALMEYAPDVVELTSMYTGPWIAFAYRRSMAKRGRQTIVSSYYLTDLPTAYVQPAAAKLVGHRTGRVARRGADRYVLSVLRRVDLAFASFPAHEKRLRELGLESPLETIPLGVDLETFHPSLRSAELRERFGVASGGMLLVYAGRLDGEKRVHLLVDAFEQLSPALDARLILIGEGPRRYELVERAAALRLATGEERLFVLPYESDTQQLARLLASADVYLSASPHEIVGLSVAEAQAAGLPVVGVASGALIDRVAPGTGRLGPIDDAKALAANILKVAAERPAMASAARQHVETTLSWERCFTRLFERYATALDQRAEVLTGKRAVA